MASAASASPPAGAARASRVALIIIDAQRDFAFPGAPGGAPAGALYVPGGEAAIGPINALRARLGAVPVFLTQDWHPPSHVSFAANNPGAALFELREIDGPGGPGGARVAQVMWPAHCVQETPGAAFVAELVRAPGDVVVRKGCHERVDSYSGFGSADGALEVTPLAGALRAAGVTHVVLAGLALDYCVAYTARDAAALGFRVAVFEPGTRGIAQATVDGERAKMRAAGVALAQTLEDVDAFAAAAAAE